MIAGYPFFDQSPAPPKPGQMPTAGGANAYQATQLSVGDVLAQLDTTKRQKALAESLMQAGYVPNSGGLGALAMIAQAFAGRKLNQRADESTHEALKRQFELDAEAKAKEVADAATKSQFEFDRQQRADLEKISATAANREGSTYTDAQGNAWNVQGTNAAPVMMDGAQAPSGQQQPSPQMDASGQPVRIDPSLPPNVQQDILANPAKYAQGGNVQAPPLVQGGMPQGQQPAPGQQLRGPPKAQPEFQVKADYLRARGVPEDQITQMVLGGGAAALPIGDGALTGNDYLATLPPGQANLVKAIAEGRQAMPNARSREGIAIARAVQNYDPAADATTIAGRVATRRAFAPSGAMGKAAKAVDQVTRHMGALQEAFAAEHNFDTPGLNWAYNKAASALGSAKPSNVIAVANAAADELESAWRGTGGSLNGIEEWRKSIGENLSPEQQAGVLNKFAELLSGAHESLQQAYANGMRLNGEAPQFISPESKAALDKFRGIDTPPNAPQAPDGRTLYHNPKTGEVIELRNGQWVPVKK